LNSGVLVISGCACVSVTVPAAVVVSPVFIADSSVVVCDVSSGMV
jgi:hypothetical protein